MSTLAEWAGWTSHWDNGLFDWLRTLPIARSTSLNSLNLSEEYTNRFLPLSVLLSSSFTSYFLFAPHCFSFEALPEERGTGDMRERKEMRGEARWGLGGGGGRQVEKTPAASP